MSNHMLTYLSFEAILKNHSITIVGYAPEEIETTVKVPEEDIRLLYGMNPAQWMQTYGDNSDELCSLFTSINGIKVSE